MDELDHFLEENYLCLNNVRKAVDDYDLYCEFLGFDLELRTKYSSPLREGDENPSFSIFPSSTTNDLLFKDNATGDSGNVYKFLSLYLGLSGEELLEQIDSRLGLGFGSVSTPRNPLIKKRVVKVKEQFDIGITSIPYSKRFLEFWAYYGISEQVLRMYYVHDVSVLFYENKDTKHRIFPKSLCIAYEIVGKYKIYQPHDPEFKFRNNYDQTYVEGALQLTYELDFIIITKSSKECLFFRQHYGWDAVAGISENTMISDFFMNYLKSKYRLIIIWLDNDEPGIKAQARYLEKYPDLIPINETGYKDKDPTDMYRFNNNKSEVISDIHKIISKAYGSYN